MKSIKICISFIAFFSLLMVSCNKIKTPPAAIERENWISGFADSIDYYRAQSNIVEQNLNEVNYQISSMLTNFEMVIKPREVSGNYILKGWQNKIPMTTTGIYARVSEKENFELIATLAGNTFNKIGIETSDSTMISDVVPHDQAFNFRHQNYNTVYFTDGKAENIADYISSHTSQKLTLVFFSDENKKVKFVIPDNEKQMVAQTWQLFAAQKKAQSLQKELWMNSRKIQTFQRILLEEKGDSAHQ